MKYLVMMSLLWSFGSAIGQDYAAKTTGTPLNGSSISISPTDTGMVEMGKPVNGYTLIFRSEKYYLRNSYGKFINAKGYSQLRDMYNNRAAFYDGSKWGYINEKGIEIIPAIYSIVFDFTKPTAAVQLEDKWAKIDLNGKVLTYLNTEAFLRQFNPAPEKPKQATPSNIGRYGATGETNRVAAACPSNISFENGDFTDWSCYIGSTACVFGNNNITVSPSAPIVDRHTIIQRTTPGAVDPWGLFDTNPPDGSNFCVRLGKTGTTGRQAERIRYIINVPPGTNSYSITYQYAVVFQDPNHANCEQPRFIATLIDPVTGANLGCATHQYVATSNIPGFLTSPLSSTVRYKRWSSVFISLTAYAGRQVYLEFTTADCTQSAHWGYAYVDVNNTSCDLTAEVSYGCDPPHITTITAPPGFNNYNWWDQNYTTLLGTTNTLVLNPGPPVGTIFNVEVFPFAGFGCRDTLPVVINSVIPTAQFAAPQAQCLANNNFTFTSTSTVGYGTIASNEWDFGDGSPRVTGSPVSHSYALPGNYTVKLISATATGCRDSVTQQVRVESPNVDFTVPTGQCVTGNSFSFNSTSTVTNGTIQSLDWDFGDGGIANGASVTHTYANAGTFPVKLVVTSSLGCKDSLTQNVIVHPQPTPLYVLPANQCLSGNSFSFISNSTVSTGAIGNLLWDFGDGNYGSGSPVQHTYANAGTYNVKLVVATNQGCRDSVTQSISVHPQPSAIFAPPSAQCLSGNVYSFASSSPGTISAYNWDFGDGNLGTGSPANHSYSIAGNHTVKLVITDNNGCKDSTTRSVTVNRQPNLSYVFPSPQCLNGNSFNFSSNSSVTGGTITSHSWDFGDLAIATGTSVSHTYATAGTFNVKLVVTTNDGCKDSVSQAVRVDSHPVGALALPAANQICDGGTQRLIATGGSVYQWYLNGNPIPNANAAVYDAPVSGTYSVSIVSAQGCPGVVPGSVTLTIVRKPVADFIFPLQCQGTPVLFNNRSDSTSAGVVAWTWFFGDGTQSGSSSPTHVFSSGGSFPVTLRAAPANCPNLASTITKMVAVEAIKPGVRYPTINTLINQNTNLIARNFGQQFAWTPTLGINNDKIVNPIFNYNSQVEYVVRITTALGCVTYDTVLVRVHKLPDVMVPTAFSPNGDGHNDLLDVFLISIKEFKYFRVYNRWGQLVFETRDASQRWDGRFKSSDQPLETYVWIAEAVGTDNVPIIRRGQTILIR